MSADEDDYLKELGDDDWLDGFDSEYVDSVIPKDEAVVMTVLLDDGSETFYCWDECVKK